MNPTANIFHRQDAKTPRKPKKNFFLFQNLCVSPLLNVLPYLASWRLGGKHVLRFLLLFLSLMLFPALPSAAQEKPAGKPPAKKNQDWTYKKYLKAFKKSGRVTRLTAPEFNRLQDRKQAMLRDIQRYLTRKFGWADPRLMKAFQDLPREYFHYDYQGGVDFSKTAYEFPPRTWALGWGSALSDYEGQAYMAQLAHPTAKDKVLEIGTGSGYNISLLSRLVKEAYSIEIIKPLGHAVSRIFKPLGYGNVHTRVGDGYYGWKEAGPFDIIMFTCVAQFVPPPLFKQLKPGGRIIIPIGQPFKHNQVLYVYRMDKRGRVHSKKYIPVYFIPMKGTMGVAAAQMGITIPGETKPKHLKTKPTPSPTPAKK
jgi:protein-L-isoaspartate(D-aspartate) O-methyltransferase